MARSRNACVVRNGSAAPSRRETTPPGDRRHEASQLGPIDQLLMGEALQAQVVDPGAKAVELGLALGHQHRPVALEAAIVADQLLDLLPQFHRGNRQRDLGEVARELAHAAGIHARGMAAGIVLLDQDRLQPAQRQMQRGRAAVDAAADHDHIGGARHGWERATPWRSYSSRPRASCSLKLMSEQDARGPGEHERGATEWRGPSRRLIAPLPCARHVEVAGRIWTVG